MAGTLFYLMGPSGVGKDTILNALRARLEDKPVMVAHRYITRPATAHGENHVALTAKEFHTRLLANSFALHWHSHDRNYGIGIEINNWLGQELSVLINGSRAYLPQARDVYPALQPILITAPEEIIAERLYKRERESAEEITHRLQQNARLNARCTTSTTVGLPTAVVTNDSSVDAAVDQLESILCHKKIPQTL